MNSIDYVIESKVPTDTDPSWYRIYKSGWVEQGGVADYGSSVVDVTRLQVTLPITMKSTDYFATEMPIRYDRDGQTNGLCAAFVGVFDLQTTYFCLRAYCGNTNERLRYIQWEVKGVKS